MAMLQSAASAVTGVHGATLVVGSFVVTGLGGKTPHLTQLFAQLSSKEITTRVGTRTAMADVFFVIDSQIKSGQTVMGIPDGYSIIRRDSKNHGIVAYFRTDLPLVELANKSMDEDVFEFIALDVVGSSPL
ncbi:hypothetical protein M885DRAFT_502019 [Pelagophyceae sp. CCMP2097]|nr:hypothetical protein M885DRAFT_502019 [Pelagophyceae sp. CCMP2097]